MEEKICACILTKLSVIKPSFFNKLLNKYGGIETLIELNLTQLELEINLEKGLFPDNSLTRWAEEEVKWCDQKRVEILIYGKENYPNLLTHCHDAPIALYYKGNADLNQKRSLSIIGTRLASSYGREVCRKVIEDLAHNNYSPLIISGLAYGIDIVAHKSALEYGLKTVAVLPCGIDSIYPSAHRSTAIKAISQGGILTEFPRGTAPLKHNFIRRNRIIAGMSEGLFLVESRIKGGSMLTVEFANLYSRDIFAVPGRVTDINSYGANYLIYKNIAMIYCNSNTIPDTLKWQKITTGADIKGQQELFCSEQDDKIKIINILKSNLGFGIDKLMDISGLNFTQMSIILLELELEGKIVNQNGIYRLK